MTSLAETSLACRRLFGSPARLHFTIFQFGFLAPLQCPVQVFLAHCFAPLKRQQLDELDQLANVTTGQVVFLGEPFVGGFRCVDFLYGALDAEQLGTFLRVGVTVFEVDERAGINGIVNGRPHVGREEANASEVFEQPEEDTHDRVLNDVTSAGADEDVRLVDQQDGIPSAGPQESVPQILLHFRRADSELADHP